MTLKGCHKKQNAVKLATNLLTKYSNLPTRYILEFEFTFWHSSWNKFLYEIANQIMFRSRLLLKVPKKKSLHREILEGFHKD